MCTWPLSCPCKLKAHEDRRARPRRESEHNEARKVRNDRRNVFDQDGLDTRAALAAEFRLGTRTLASGEALRGAQTFAQGAGRHGSFGPAR